MYFTYTLDPGDIGIWNPLKYFITPSSMYSITFSRLFLHFISPGAATVCYRLN